MGTTSISVLIPNYDWNVTKLILQLHTQLLNCGVDFEILCFDNCAESIHSQANETLNLLSNTQYQIRASLGRAQNRNALAQAAKHHYILFLDGDADVSQNPNFIAQYLNYAKPNTVVCGGTAYAKHTANDHTLLRYVYGKKREEISAEQRQKNTYAGFTAFNFFMPKDVFLLMCFNETLSKYGHEDTLFGRELKHRCIPIIHIQNPAIHLGLDTCDVFLSKTRHAVENLSDLINEGLIDEDIKLYAWYLRMKKTGITRVLHSLFTKFQKTWEKQLCSQHPNLMLFDLYKLSYLCSLPIHNKKPPVHKI